MTQVLQTYVKQGRDLAIVTRAEGQVVEELPVGVYRLCFNPIRGWWFSTMKNFSLPEKLYGNVGRRSKRILDTYHSRMERGVPTGVLLSGIKGSGKTLLAMKVSVDSGLPIIVINEPHTTDDFKEIIANVGPCVLIFDEFEKVYHEEEKQNTVLTLLNGVFSNQVLSFIIVNNSLKLVGPLKNRPGRLFYNLEYGGLDEDFIREYLADRLDSVQTHGHFYDEVTGCSTDCIPDEEATAERVQGVLSVSAMFDHFTFDHLQAMVEEMNRYGETAQEVIEFLNVKLPKPSYFDTYEVRVWRGDTEITELQDKSFRVQSKTPINTYIHLSVKTGGKDSDGDDNAEYFNLQHKNLVNVDIKTQSFTFRYDDLTIVYKKMSDEERRNSLFGNAL